LVMPLLKPVDKKNVERALRLATMVDDEEICDELRKIESDKELKSLIDVISYMNMPTIEEAVTGYFVKKTIARFLANPVDTTAEESM
jgi:hypothetical protein